MSFDNWSGLPATSAESAESDLWLWRVMQSAKNKAMIARLEASLHAFVQDTSQTQLPFPPRNAFHRKVCYLVARRYGLDHRLEEYCDPPARAMAPGESVRLVLIKTPHTTAPAQSLAALALVGEAPVGGGREGGKAVPAGPECPEDAQQRGAQPPGTTFLRRPRTADGKAARTPKAAGGAGAGPSVATLKSYSEEDYRRARARIFKNPDASGDGIVPEEDELLVTGGTRVVNIGIIAKGPVQGSAGFERRRNRPSNPTLVLDSTLGETKPNAAVSGKSGQNDAAGTPGHGLKIQGRQEQLRETRELRFSHEHSHHRTSFSTAPMGGSVTEPLSQPALMGARRQAGYPTAHHTQRDRQDPDFDRRYDKWAVRRAPPPAHHPPQQVAVPLFSQLLFPYAVQGASPHMHPSSLHMGSVNAPGGQMQQGSLNQYAPMQHHHAPSGAMVFQHMGQGVNGISADYSRRQAGISDHHVCDAPEMGHMGTSRFSEIGAFQQQSLPQAVARKPSPAYGLDSTVDFPPLP